jgi:hypothetical protein
MRKLQPDFGVWLSRGIINLHGKGCLSRLSLPVPQPGVDTGDIQDANQKCEAAFTITIGNQVTNQGTKVVNLRW